MNEYKSDKLRNIALIGHSSSGKTSLAEALLFNTGATSRLGKVDDSNTVSDFDAEEQRRKISISTSVVPCEWNGYKINIIDTPGYIDFAGEMKGALRVADCAVILVDAVAGIEVGTELVWQYCEELNLPRVIYINKMDRENADFFRVLDQLRERYGKSIAALQLPIGREASFKGEVNVVNRKAFIGKSEGEIPADLQDAVEERRAQLVEIAAESDDKLIEKYFDTGELSDEEIRVGLEHGVAGGTLVPVLCGSATQNIGVDYLHKFFADYVPSPVEMPSQVATNLSTNKQEKLSDSDNGPLAAFVWKTQADPYVGKLTYFRVYSGTMMSDSRVNNSRTNGEERIGQLYVLRGKEQLPIKHIYAGDLGAVAKLNETSTNDTLCDKAHPLELEKISYPNPVYSVALTPKSKTDLDKMGPALQKLVDEDPTLRVYREPGTGESIMAGMGDSHVDVAVRRLKQKFGVELVTGVPKIPYKETITKKTEVQGRHKKQTGGRGQFGDTWIRFEPLPRGTGFEFTEEVFGGAVPNQYIPAVEKGMREIILRGVLAGYPTTDFRAVLYDGSYHPVDSSEMAFKLAAHKAFKQGIPTAGPVLLEPVMNMEITVPENFMGDIIGDLNTKRARVQGMDQKAGWSIITAQAPLAEIARYATDLRSMTQGRGYFTMEFSHYDIVPSHIAAPIIEHAKKERAGEVDEEE
ncbi:MAG: elongation factor G [Chloroflexota bacterium]|nr:MAG: elongation factor G [Chloroflexota bacterium]